MRDRDLRQAAVHAGIAPDWTDAFGARRQVAADTLRALLDVVQVDPHPAQAQPALVPRLLIADAARAVLKLPAALCRRARRARIVLEHGGHADCAVRPGPGPASLRLARSLPPGYHCLEIGGLHVPLAAAPARCYGIADALGASDPRAWGLAVQVYSLRRAGDFGVGDFGALAELAHGAGVRGAHALAVSPLHAMFGADSARYSPYAPSSRLFLNTMHADPRSAIDVADLARSIRRAGLAGELRALQRAPLIDWPRAAAAQRRVFEAIFARFAAGELGGAAAFARFRSEGGNALAAHACFEALAEYRTDGAARATTAPPPAQSAAAHAFAHARADRIAFHAFLQWRAACDLDAVQAAARDSGMGIGLIGDLAVGVDPAGSECWSRPAAMLLGAGIGAPPDELNALGQDWGLTTFSPQALVRDGYAPFLDVLRAAMRRGGGVRLDHVMSLMRLWLVPRGAAAVDGAYLRYPFADLVRLVALESWRQRCIVIGEDLGTVPHDCRRRLAGAGVLGLDVLPFMRAGAAFLAPRRWRRDAVAMTSTHDIATVAGWWRARDLDWRRRLHLYGAVGEKAERATRTQARAQLARMLAATCGVRLSARSAPARVVDAAVEAVGSAPSPLVLVPVEDLLGASEQPNLPGTTSGHPNWRRRYPGNAARLPEKRAVAARLRRLARARRPHGRTRAR